MNIFNISSRALLCAFFLVTTAQAFAARVCILQTVEHPALDATTRGIIDALEAAGYKKGENLALRVESAQANAALAAQIASKFASQKPDVVVGVGTTAAQSLAKYANQGTVKLVFSTVTDPLGAGLVSDLKRPGGAITGVSNFVPLAPQLELFKRLQPGLTKLGILYNPGEANSVSIVAQLETLCPQFGLALIKQTCAKTADIPQAAANLASKAQAIFISNDNTALGSLPAIIKAAQMAKIPVYVSDTDAVTLGALAALGPNQYAVGQQTGAMVARILEGASTADMPVEFPQTTQLVLNEPVAASLGIVIPESIKEKATQCN